MCCEFPDVFRHKEKTQLKLILWDNKKTSKTHPQKCTSCDCHPIWSSKLGSMLFIPSFVDYKLKDLIKAFHSSIDNIVLSRLFSCQRPEVLPPRLCSSPPPTDPSWPSIFTSKRLTREAKSSGRDGDGERNSNLLQTASLINTQVCIGMYTNENIYK